MSNNKKIAFTLCAINYIAQAKNLFDTIKKTNPDWRFIVGLVDKNDTVDLSFLECEILQVDKIPIEGFEDMVKRYTIVELLTSVKPFYFTHFFTSYPDVDKIIYFDPDIMVFAPLTSLEDKLTNYDVILTPHFTTPIEEDGCLPSEIEVFKKGVYNLGFLALARSENTTNLLHWWEKKLRKDCIIDLTRGYFVDQLWMSLAPAYFDKVLIDKYPGYNTAHWNFHERTVTKKGNEYFVNGMPLIFFHFSHYNPTRPDQITPYHNRFSFESRPDLVELFDMYRANLLKLNFPEFKKITCYYMNDEAKKQRRRNIENFLRQALPKEMKGKIKKFIKK